MNIKASKLTNERISKKKEESKSEKPKAKELPGKKKPDFSKGKEWGAKKKPFGSPNSKKSFSKTNNKRGGRG